MIPLYQNLILWVTVTPLIGALILLLIPNRNRILFEIGSLIIAIVDLLLSIPLLLQYNRQSASTQWNTIINWIPSLGIQFNIGIDGISLLLILLTTLLGFVVILYSPLTIKERYKEYYTWILLMQFSMLGVFIAQDVFLFYLFWELMLVPMYFLIAIWGGPQRLYAAIKLFIYTLSGSVLMLVAILAIYFLQHKTTGCYNMSMASFQLMSTNIAQQSHIFQFLTILAFFICFAIKVPMFPFHTWLPDAHVEAPTTGSIILAGILLKMGTYGFIRFLLPLLSPNSMKIIPWFIGLALIGVIYGALIAMIQKDIKKLVAYSSVSHLGLCMIGLFTCNPNGITGGILQMINHGISTSALFLLVGIIYERRHTRMISEYGGLAKLMPIYATIFMIMTMSSIGLPGLNGFIGEFAILQGAFQTAPWLAIVSTTSIVLGAAYMLWLFQRVMFGSINEKNSTLKDLNVREILCFIPLIILAFWIGLYPKPMMDILDKPVQKLVQQIYTSN